MQYLYVIYDKVAEEASPIFQAKNDELAARFAAPTIAGGLFEQDYELLRIGAIEGLVPGRVDVVEVPFSEVLSQYKAFQAKRKGLTPGGVITPRIDDLKVEEVKENE